MNDLVKVPTHQIIPDSYNAYTKFLDGIYGGGGCIRRGTIIPCITFPSKDSIFWTLPGSDGGRAEKELVGSILAWKTHREYYENAFASGAKKPPLCTSVGGNYGNATGSSCRSCPMNQKGSAPQYVNGYQGSDKNRACRAKVIIQFLETGKKNHFQIQVPSTSMENLLSWIYNMDCESLQPSDVEVSLTLKTNESGSTPFPQMQLMRKRTLEGAEKEFILGMSKSVTEYLEPDTPGKEDASDPEFHAVDKTEKTREEAPADNAQFDEL